MTSERISLSTLAMLFSALVSACLGTEQAELELGEVQAPITRSTLTDNVDLEWFGLLDDFPNCSGSAISERWIITAAHCSDVQVGALVQFLGRPYVIDAVHRHPNGRGEDDVMIAHLTSDLLDADGNVWVADSDIFGHTYVSEPRHVADNSVTMMCYGRSTLTYERTPEAGRYRSALFTAFRASSVHLVELESQSGESKFAGGDSGGPCYRFEGGYPVYVGLINRDGAEDADGAVSDGRIAVLTSSKVAWIDSIVH
jgi:hypothetical protein